MQAWIKQFLLRAKAAESIVFVVHCIKNNSAGVFLELIGGLKETLDHRRVEHRSRRFTDFLLGILEGKRFAIGPLHRESIECVGSGKDPRPVRDIFTLEAARIAGAIEMLVVAANDIRCLRKVADVTDDPVADFGVPVHNRLLFRRERPPLLEHGVGNTDLADIMKQCAAVEVNELSALNTAGVSDDQGELGYAH